MRIKKFYPVFLVLILLTLSSSSYAGTVEFEYRSAKDSYHRLMQSKTKKKYRSNWIKTINRFEDIYKHYPKSSYAPKALFVTGRLYSALYGYSYKKDDALKAVDFYRLLVNTYPESSLADDAQFQLSEIFFKKLKRKKEAYKEYLKVVERFPKGDMVAKARSRLKELKDYKSAGASAVFSAIKSIRHWSNPNYTRVVIDLSKNVSFNSHILKADPSAGKPPRLYIDLNSTRIGKEMKKPIIIDDGLLEQIRAGQYNRNIVRVVLDFKSLSDYKVFSLAEPFRVIVDIKGSSPSEKIKETSPVPSLAQQLGLKIKKIIIDPGHGGKDPGAIGMRGLKEKDVVLKVAKRLKEKLVSKGYKVLMTRDRDVFIPLEERTAFANTREADLFVSIHVNASPNRRVHGIETYYLNLAKDEEAMRVASRENAISNKKMGDLQFILHDLMQTSKVKESSKLAGFIQGSLAGQLSRKHSNILNLGVKQAPFYVLIGAHMPSVLVETSFISNPADEKRLKKKGYLDNISEGILRGIERYIKHMNSVALNR